jgi:hypothetical protein
MMRGCIIKSRQCPRRLRDLSPSHLHENQQNFWSARTPDWRIFRPRDLAGACSGGKFVVSRAGEAYDVRARGGNRNFLLNHAHRPMCQFASV